MRIRQIRPEFWTDELLAAQPDAVRLFYIGLWGVADDAGWLEWRPSRIGALLYPYRPSRKREADIEAWGVALTKIGRIEHAACGLHAVTPTLHVHQRVGGRPNFSVITVHRAEERSSPAVSQSFEEIVGSFNEIVRR